MSLFNNSNEVAEVASEVVKASRSAADYWLVLRTFLPIAVLGGWVAVVMQAQAVFKAPTWKLKFFIFLSEWSVGAAAAMLTALLLPTLCEMLPVTVNPSIEAEVGLSSFIGGSLGKSMFHWMTHKLLGKFGTGQAAVTDFTHQPEGTAPVLTEKSETEKSGSCEKTAEEE